jgi:hypothetical protein
MVERLEAGRRMRVAIVGVEGWSFLCTGVDLFFIRDQWLNCDKSRRFSVLVE